MKYVDMILRDTNSGFDNNCWNFDDKRNGNFAKFNCGLWRQCQSLI